MDSKKQFSSPEHVLLYSKYRPDTPAFIMDKIIQVKIKTLGHAIDIACGAGQSTKPLVNHFNRVTGIDVSEAQITQASQSIPNANFVNGLGEEINFIDEESVDLVTICNGIHWLNKDDIFKEVKRVLKPSGVVAIYVCTLYEELFCEDDEITDSFKEWDNKYIRGYINPKAVNVYEQHLNMNLPFKDVERVELRNTEHWTLDQFIGYITTLSAYQRFMKDNPGRNIIQELQERLSCILQQRDKDSNYLLKISWPVVIVQGRK